MRMRGKPGPAGRDFSPGKMRNTKRRGFSPLKSSLLTAYLRG